MLHVNTILFPTDFCDPADHALDLARSLARDHDARLIIFSSALPPTPVPEFFPPMGHMPGQVEELKRRLVELSSTIDDVPVDIHAAEGDPGSAIVAFADEIQADLIVMGTHGRSGLSRWVMGSVVEYVIRHAHCPVLTLRPGADRIPVKESLTASTSMDV